MKHNIRNSMILSALLVLILIVKLILGFQMNKKITLENEKLKKNKNEAMALKSVQADTMQVYLVKLKIAATEGWVKQYGKYMLKEDNSRATWDYLNMLVNTYCSQLDFNFENIDQNTDAQATGLSYKISGNTDILTLYTFLSHIEKQPALYTVEQLSIDYFLVSEENQTPIYNVNFEFILKSWMTPEGKPVREIATRNNFPDKIAFNCFYPKIHPFIKLPSEEQYIQSEELILVSMTPQKAFFKNKEGKVFVMVKGSRVAYGYLSSINWNSQSVTFKLNKIGVYKDFNLYLDKE